MRVRVLMSAWWLAMGCGPATGLHEPHTGESYLGRETVNRFRVAQLDACHNQGNRSQGDDNERYSSFHLRFTICDFPIVIRQNLLMSCIFTPVNGVSNRQTPPEQV